MIENLFFAGILKVNDENRRIRIQDPDPDPLVRGMDPCSPDCWNIAIVAVAKAS
jgi:hypothetical protein